MVLRKPRSRWPPLFGSSRTTFLDRQSHRTISPNSLTGATRKRVRSRGAIPSPQDAERPLDEFLSFHLDTLVTMKHFSIALIWASAVVAMSAGCPLPISYAWTDSGPLAYSELAVPVDSGIHGTSLKDLTYVSYHGRHLVYASFTQGHQAGSVAFGTFSEWSGMASATQTQMQDTLTTIAPTLFYFRPKDIWVLAYQGDRSSVSASPSASWATFSYMLSTTPDDPSAWYGAQPLFAGHIPNQVFGHPSLIGDSTMMYLFFQQAGHHLPLEHAYG
jgi:hypothetical protein